MNPKQVVASWAPPQLLRSRIDAEFYSPDALENASWISAGHPKTEQLARRLSLLTDGVHETPQFVEAGVMYMTASNVEECHLNLDKGFKFTDEKTYQRYDRMNCAPKSGDVLLTKSGRVGYAAVVPPGLRFSVLHSAAILRPEKVDPHFMAAFIHSRHGQDQIERFQKGAVQPMLHLEEIAEIRIPVLGGDLQEAIGNRLRKSERLRELADSCRAEIDRWVESNAGGSHLPLDARAFLEHSPSATVRDWTWASTVPTADRIDPWPYHVAPRTIRAHLNTHGRVYPLAQLAERLTRTRPRVSLSDPEVDGHYVSVLDLDSDGRIDWGNARVSRYSGGGLQLEPGDLLFSRINPRQQRVAAVPRHMSGLLVGSPEFVILKSLSNLFGHPHLLAAVLRSGWVRVQTTFLTRSSSLSRRRLDEEDLDTVLVPWSDGRLDELEAVAQKALDHELEAASLVNQARKAVEDLIDGEANESTVLSEGHAIEKWLADNPAPTPGA